MVDLGIFAFAFNFKAGDGHSDWWEFIESDGTIVATNRESEAIGNGFASSEGHSGLLSANGGIMAFWTTHDGVVALS